jgi:hypothetical protein
VKTQENGARNKETHSLHTTKNRTNLLFNRNNGSQKTIEYLQSAPQSPFQYFYPVKIVFKNEAK